MLHPVMPHLTEELYSFLPLPEKGEFLMSSAWPSLPEEFLQSDAEEAIEQTFAITVAARALRASVDLSAMKPIPLAYYEGEIPGGAAIVASQAWIQELRVGKPEGDEKFLSATAGGVRLHLPLTGLVDPQKLLSDLTRDEVKLLAEKTQLDQRLSNPQFIERAKPEAIERDRARAEEIQARLADIAQRRTLFE
jgi:valyl-tRNA synthetase